MVGLQYSMLTENTCLKIRKNNYSKKGQELKQNLSIRSFNY
jgi:hypothetical protein